MELNNVVLEIINEAEKKANEIAKAADRERQKILDEARENIKRRKGEMKKNTEDRLKQARTKELAISRTNAKKIEMNAKKNIIEHVYRDFSQAIYSIGREKILMMLFKPGKAQIDVSKIYISNSDFEIAKKLFSDAKVIKKDITGGMVLENSDGTEMLDLSLPTIVEDLEKETVNDVSKILFGE